MPKAVGRGIAIVESPAPQPSAGATWPGLAVTVGTPLESVAISQPHMALPALPAAAESNPLQAALDAVFAAVVTYGESHPALLQHIWAASGPAVD